MTESVIVWEEMTTKDTCRSALEKTKGDNRSWRDDRGNGALCKHAQGARAMADARNSRLQCSHSVARVVPVDCVCRGLITIGRPLARLLTREHLSKTPAHRKHTRTLSQYEHTVQQLTHTKNCKYFSTSLKVIRRFTFKTVKTVVFPQQAFKTIYLGWRWGKQLGGRHRWGGSSHNTTRNPPS